MTAYPSPVVADGVAATFNVGVIGVYVGMVSASFAFCAAIKA